MVCSIVYRGAWATWLHNGNTGRSHFHCGNSLELPPGLVHASLIYDLMAIRRTDYATLWPFRSPKDSGYASQHICYDGTMRNKQSALLKELQKRLSGFSFDINRPGPSFTELERGLIDGKSGKHVVYWGNASQLTATLFYGGAQFTIARQHGMTPAVVQTIGRIADAACCYFWKYRKRRSGTEVPDQSQLNFPIQFAQDDLKSEPVLLGIFKQMETELLRLGYITTETELVTTKMQFAQLNSEIAALTVRLNQHQARIDSLVERVLPQQEPVSIPTAEGNIWSNK